MVDSLKDCPFCGESVDINDDDTIYPINRERTVWQCGCNNMDCCASVLGESREHSIKLWNVRFNEK